ncbi:hypothetical protein [Streptomyces sp. NPDC093514]|uniref:hypothetical protein n=1 Tax=Streptomyces sp. NPDC093514 TaxID=3366039 RepID=UPI00382774B9
MPSAAAIRFAASYGEIASRGIAARTATASTASTVDRDHAKLLTSGSGTTPTCRAQRRTSTVVCSRCAVSVILGGGQAAGRWYGLDSGYGTGAVAALGTA